MRLIPNIIKHFIVSVSVFCIFFMFAFTSHAKDTIYLFNWSQYMSPKIIIAFEDKYDVKVSQSFYESNEEMFAKLRSGGDRQYDLVFPSYYYIPRLINSKLIQKLDKDQIPNLSNLLPRFSSPDYDPGNLYSIPYQWGDNGIIYDSKTFPNVDNSWSLLFDPEINKHQPFSLMKSTQVTISAACAYLGFGYDCNKQDQWLKAAKLIEKTVHRKNFTGFVEGTPTVVQLARGNIKVGMAFNGDYAFQKIEDPGAYAHTKFMVPKEGAELWVDTMAIPANAPSPDLANKFVNFILDAKIGAELSNYNAYSSPNKAAQVYLDDNISEPPILPTDEEMQTLRIMPILKGKDQQFMQQLWTEILSK